MVKRVLVNKKIINICTRATRGDVAEKALCDIETGNNYIRYYYTRVSFCRNGNLRENVTVDFLKKSTID